MASNTEQKNLKLIDALSNLKTECDQYSVYLKEQVGEQSLEDTHPLMAKKLAVEGFISTLNSSDTPEVKATNFINDYNAKKGLFIKSSDAFVQRFFKAVAYVIVSLGTGLLFNLGRIVRRAATENAYVRFSAGFNSEKFNDRALAKIAAIEEAKKPTRGFDDPMEMPTEPLEYNEKNEFKDGEDSQDIVGRQRSNSCHF